MTTWGYLNDLLLEQRLEQRLEPRPYVTTSWLKWTYISPRRFFPKLSRDLCPSIYVNQTERDSQSVLRFSAFLFTYKLCKLCDVHDIAFSHTVSIHGQRQVERLIDVGPAGEICKSHASLIERYPENSTKTTRTCVWGTLHYISTVALGAAATNTPPVGQQ